LISITIGLELVKLLINCSRHKMGVVDQNLRKKLADWGIGTEEVQQHYYWCEKSPVTMMLL
jgi:hypothetical protein